MSKKELAATPGPVWTQMRRMTQNRVHHTSTLLPTGEVLVTGGEGYNYQPISSFEVYDPTRDNWSLVGSMTRARCQHSATLLPNGKVLVVGGWSLVNNTYQKLSSAELYDPSTREWTAAGALATARSDHTATLLPNGKVLIVGGETSDSKMSNLAEEYDPESNTWFAAPSLKQARYFHTATLLPDGRVLVLGTSDYAQPATAPSLEIYDPTARQWTHKTMPANVFGHTATLLLNGKVLVVGGFKTQGGLTLGTSRLVSLYDPVTDSWSSLSPLTQARDRHTATLLSDGRVLITGGSVSIQGSRPPTILVEKILRITELYDPVTNQWSSAGDLVTPRHLHTAILLPTGKLFLMGGSDFDYVQLVNASTEAYDTTTRVAYAGPDVKLVGTVSLLPDGRLLLAGDGNSSERESWIYDTDTNTWSSTRPMIQKHYHHTVTTLPDGRILAIGGWYKDSKGAIEVYDPATETWSTVRSLEPAFWSHTATLLPNGKVLVVGGVTINSTGQWETLSSAHLFDPKTQTWSPTGSLQLPRAGHTATLLMNGKVLVVGGGIHGDYAMALSELYDPTTNRWSSGGTLSAARFDHTATLLRNGKVLVIGGYDAAFLILSEMEEYDPVTNRWSALKIKTPPRAQHAAVSLPGGEVLVLGGLQSSGYHASFTWLYEPVMNTWASVDVLPWTRLITAMRLVNGKTFVFEWYKSAVYDTKLASESLRPRITQASPSTLEPGSVVTVTGEGFLGFSEPTLVSLYSVETGQWYSLPGGNSSNTSITVRLPYAPVGQYLLNVTVHAVTSSKVVYITNTTPPKTTLVTQAPTTPLTRQTAAAFSFTSEDVDFEAFRCSLDGNPLSTCTSPMAYVSLSDGVHSFKVYSLDRAGNVEPTPAESRWTIDTAGPDISLSAQPPLEDYSPSAQAVFTFTSRAQDIDHFECSLDAQAFAPCTSPFSAPGLRDGAHSFEVKAVDKLGNVTLPAEYVRHWVVDTEAPTPVLSSRPPRFTHESDVVFTFSSEPNIAFSCNMDSEVFTPCASGQRYVSLKDGKHSFLLRAMDQAGNATTSPGYEWTVDTLPPKTHFTSAPPRVTRLSDMPFSFSADEEAHWSCRLDGTEFIPCSSPQDYSALADGSHTFQVQATDLAGNKETDVLDYTWVVDTVRPESPMLQEPVPQQHVFSSTPVVSGTAESGSTVDVFIDGVLVTTVTTDDEGVWRGLTSPLSWGSHRIAVIATDPAGNSSPVSRENAFVTEQRGYYGLGCAASPAAMPVWPLTLLLLKRSRREGRARQKQ